MHEKSCLNLCKTVEFAEKPKKLLYSFEKSDIMMWNKTECGSSLKTGIASILFITMPSSDGLKEVSLMDERSCALLLNCLWSILNSVIQSPGTAQDNGPSRGLDSCAHFPRPSDGTGHDDLTEHFRLYAATPRGKARFTDQNSDDTALEPLALASVFGTVQTHSSIYVTHQQNIALSETNKAPSGKAPEGAFVLKNSLNQLMIAQKLPNKISYSSSKKRRCQDPIAA
jgi:hypothetical protein